MIVFDASSLVSAAFGPGSVPDRAVRHAFQTDTIAVSERVMVELLDVLYRPRLARLINPEQRADLLIGLTRRLAACFTDARNPAFIEHDVQTLVMQRVVGIALGYEDLVDHDELRHDPVMAVLSARLQRAMKVSSASFIAQQ